MDLIASFLAGSILSLVLPVALLVAIMIWWLVIVRRRSSNEDM